MFQSSSVLDHKWQRELLQNVTFVPLFGTHLCINTCLASTSDSCGAAEWLSHCQNNLLTSLSSSLYVLSWRQTLFMCLFDHVNMNVTDGLWFLSAELRHGKHENKMQSISNDGYEALWLKGQPTFSNHGTKERWPNLELIKMFHLCPHLNDFKGLSRAASAKPILPPTHRHLLAAPGSGSNWAPSTLFRLPFLQAKITETLSN